MLFSFTPSFDMRFLKGVGSHKSWYFFFCFLSTSSSWSKYICSICWTVWKYTTLSFTILLCLWFHSKSNMMRVSKLHLKNFKGGGWGGVITEELYWDLVFFLIDETDGYNTFLFQFSVWISVKSIFKILIWTVQIKRYEEQVLD